MEILVLTLLTTAVATASSVTYKFGGEVNGVFDTNNHLNGKVRVGETYTGSVTWDVTAPLYLAGPDYNLTINIGGFAISDFGDPDAAISASQGSEFTVFGAHFTPPDFITFPDAITSSIRVQLFGNYINLVDDSIPDPTVFRFTPDPVYGQSSQFAIYMNAGSSDQTFLSASITTFDLASPLPEPSPAPEPSALFLMTGGLAALALARRTIL